MAGFLDFVQQAGDLVPGGTNAIPAWLTALLVKKPNTANPANALPYYQSIAAGAANANEFANANADMFNNEYRPAAVAFNQRAQGIGSAADLAEASGRGAANFNVAFDKARTQQKQSMAGVNPNSGAAMARKGALDASFAPGVVHAMNAGRLQREQYGDEMRAKALPFLATQPNYALGMSGAGAAGAGIAGLGRDAYNQYRQEAGDTVKALKLPFDLADSVQRAGNASGSLTDLLDKLRARFPSGDVAQGMGDAAFAGADAGDAWFAMGGRVK